MFIKIVENQGTGIEDGNIFATVEVIDGDTAIDNVFTLPNFESRALTGKKFGMFKTASGDYFFLGIPLETTIEPGEFRIVWTDTSGTIKGKMHGKADGTLSIECTKLEIKNTTAELIAVLYNAFTALSTANAGGFPLSCAAQMTTAATKINSFKV